MSSTPLPIDGMFHRAVAVGVDRAVLSQEAIQTGRGNAVLALMLTTAILGPVLAERFAPRLREEAAVPKP